MCYKTPLTNQELKSIGYRESMFNDYLYKFYGNYDAIVTDNETREVSHPYIVTGKQHRMPLKHVCVIRLKV